MRKFHVSIFIIIMVLTGCSGQSSGLLSQETGTAVMLPVTWTPKPDPTTTISPVIPTPTPLLSHTIIPSSTPETKTHIPFQGAEQWWLQLPGSSLVGTSQTRSGDLLLLIRSSQSDSSSPYTVLRLDPSGQISWQKKIDGPRYLQGILETGDGGLLILEPQQLHKISQEGDPLWSRLYFFSEIGSGQYLFGPIDRIRPAGNGKQAIGIYGDIATFDSKGLPLNVDLNYLVSSTSGDYVSSRIEGGIYWGEQESRSIYKLTRRSNSSATWDIRFDFIAFDITLFPPHLVLGTQDGGALFLAPAPHLQADGGFSIFATRLDRYGAVLWMQIYEGIYEDDFFAKELVDGGFLIANNESFYGTEYSGSFLRITRLNRTGDLVWDRVYGNGETQIQIQGIFENPEGGYQVVGQHGFRGDNDSTQGISVLSVDSQGRIPGCTYLAELPKAETFGKSPSSELSVLSPGQTRKGEISQAESTEVKFTLQDSNLEFEVNCSYPIQENLIGEEENPSLRVHIFADEDGLIIGGVQDDEWYSANETVSQLSGTTSFQLYNLKSFSGLSRGDLSDSPSSSKCQSSPYLNYAPGDYSPFRIALDGNWNALPRIPFELSTSIPVYQDAVRNQLKEYGFKSPHVSIDHIYQIDLDGDGGDEILILANYNAQGMYRDQVTAGDYSLLLLRYLKQDQVVTIPLYERWITTDSTFYRPAEIQLHGLADLNGDGIIEIVAKEAYRGRSFGYVVYDFEKESSDPSLYTWCGE